MLFFNLYPEWSYWKSFDVLEVARLEISPAVSYLAWVMNEFRPDSQYFRISFEICICHRIEDAFASCYLQSFDLHPSVEAVFGVGKLYRELAAVLHAVAFYCLRAVA